MKHLELEKLYVQELNEFETNEINGGSELTENIVRGVAWLTHNFWDNVSSINWGDPAHQR